MTEFFEAVMLLLASLSLIIVFLLLALSIKSKAKILSDKGREIVIERKQRFFTAVFFGVLALSFFVVTEIFEASEVVFMVLPGPAIKKLEIILLLSSISAQLIILSILLEVHRRAH